MTAFRLAACAALSLALGSPAPAQVPVHHIELKSFAYHPTPIHLKARKPVTLRFMNRAGSGHDFTARRFFASARILSGAAPAGEVEVGAGKAAAVTLIPAAGRYKVHCGHPFHKQMGMKGLIVVD